MPFGQKCEEMCRPPRNRKWIVVASQLFLVRYVSGVAANLNGVAVAGVPPPIVAQPVPTYATPSISPEDLITNQVSSEQKAGRPVLVLPLLRLVSTRARSCACRGGNGGDGILYVTSVESCLSNEFVKESSDSPLDWGLKPAVTSWTFLRWDKCCANNNHMSISVLVYKRHHTHAKRNITSKVPTCRSYARPFQRCIFLHGYCLC